MAETSHLLDINEKIPGTKFSIGFLLSCLNSSPCAQWHHMTADDKNMPTTIKVENLAGKGYLSAVYRLTLGGFCRNTDEVFRAVLKVPTIDILRRIYSFDSIEKVNYMVNKIVELHNREVAFYNKIAPIYLQGIDGLSNVIPQAFGWEDFKENRSHCGKIEENSGECSTNEITNSAVKLGDGFLLLEDMTARDGGDGCFQVDENDGLNDAQVRSVMSAMARLHAHSLAIPKDLLETHFQPQERLRFPRQFLQEHLCSLPGKTGASMRENSDALTNFLQQNEEILDAKQSEKFSVLCHGDLWVNNLLFVDDGKLCGILDWQCVHIGSGLSDVANLLLTGVEPSARRAGTQQWLAHYHSTFVECLRAQPELLPTTEKLENFETIKALYSKQFPAHVYSLMCLVTFLVNKQQMTEEDRVTLEKLREKLTDAFDEIKDNYRL